MVDVRRLVAGIASVVLMVGVFASPSGAVAAPLSTDPPVVSAEASDDELAVAATADDDATSQDQEKPSVDAKEPAPDPKQEEPKPSADPKADEGASDESSPKPKPPADTTPAKPSTGGDDVSDARTPPGANDGDVSSSDGTAKSSDSDNDVAPDGDGATAGAHDDPTLGDGGAPADDEPVPADAGRSTPAAVPIRPLALGQLSTITAKRVADGTIAANGPVIVNGVTLDGSDDNDLVAVWDTVKYAITANYGAANNGDTMSLVGVLPPGVTWQPGSYSQESCDVSGTGQNNTGTFTCKWTAGDETVKTFSWFARPGSPWANGTSFAPEFRDGNGTSSATGPSLEVVSAFSYNVAWGGLSSSANQVLQRDGEPDVRGFVVLLQVDAEGVGNDAHNRGMEAAAAGASFQMVVPSGVVMWGCSSATCSQPAGPGGPIYVTKTNGFRSNESTTNGRYSVQLFVPYSLVTPGVTYTGQVQVLGFDPVSASGVSNFGDSFASGQEPGVTCSTGGLCRNFSVLLRDDVAFSHRFTFGRAVGTTQTLFGTSNPYYGSTLSSYGRIVPGESFAPLLEMMNAGSAGVAMTDVASCVTWDRSLAELTGPARVDALTAMSSNFSNTGWTSSLMTGDVMPAPDYELRYAAVSGLTPGSFDCDGAGSGGAAAMWVSDPTTLPDGVGSVNAIRLKLTVPVDIGTKYGLAFPARRTTSAASLGLAPGGRITFYNRQTANELAAAASASGWVGADQALVRASTQVRAGASWAASTTGAAGNEVVFRVSPTVIGPAADIDTVATNTQIQLTFNSACVDVAATLEALAAYDPVVSLGGGLAACGPTAAAGPVITLNLGDVVALGSSAPVRITDSSVGGNERPIRPPIEIPVILSTRTPSGLSVTMNTRISSTSDTTGLSSSVTSALDRWTMASVMVNTASTFTARKSVYTAEAGLVDPGESYVYGLMMSNTEPDDYGVASMVDVLPFEGDPRLTRPGADGVMGTGDDVQLADGLAGGRRLTVTGASASMLDGDVPPNTLPVDVYCSTTDPALIYASLATDKSGGLIQDWVDCSSSIPAGTTAVRFVTSGPLVSFGSVSATIRVTAPVLAVGGSVVNDMAFHAPVDTGDDAQEGFVGVPAVLQSSAASLAGTVRQDWNFNESVDAVGAEGDGWWPSPAVVQLLTPGGDPVIDLVSGEPYTTPLGADGEFEFPVVPAGDYLVGVAGVDGEVWRLVLSTASVTVPVASTDKTVDVLYQEVVPAPVLVNDPESDPIRVKVGGTVRIDVTANDTLTEPSVSTADVADVVLEGDGATDRGGRYVLVDEPGAKYDNQPQVDYQAPEVWPSEEEGTSYTDTFDYSWTNVAGEKKSATVTVTVQKPPTASNGTDRIALDGSTEFAAAPQTAGSIVRAECSELSQGEAGASTAGVVSFDAEGAEAGRYVFTVTWTDDLEQTGTSSYTVWVQAPPTATDGSATIGVAGGGGTDTAASLNGVPEPDPQLADLASIDYARTAVASVTASRDGDVDSVSTSVNPLNGVVTFSATVAGEYLVVVSYYDDLGQRGEAEFTVTVQAGPTATPVTRTIGESDGGGTVTSVLLNGEPKHDSKVGTAGIDLPATVRGEVTTTGGDLESVVVSLQAGVVTFSASAPGIYTVPVTYYDNLAQPVTISHTVTVQEVPTATAETRTIGESDGGGTVTSVALWGDPKHDSNVGTAEINLVATVRGEVTRSDGGPVSASAVVQPDGRVLFASSEPGVYSVPVTYYDNLAQPVTVSHTVTVQAVPTATPVTPTIGESDGGGTKTSVALWGDPKHDPNVGTADINLVATVRGEVTRSDGGPVSASAVVQPDGRVLFSSSEPGVYSVPVTYYDNLGQPVTVSHTVTVQAVPVVADRQVVLPLTGSNDSVVVSAAGSIVIDDSGLAGSVSVTLGDDNKLIVASDGAEPGVSSFTVSVTDDLGQTGTGTITVIVQDRPTAEGDQHTIGVANGNGTIKSVDLWGDPKPDREVLSAKIDPAKTVRGDITTGDGDLASVEAKVDLTTGRVVFSATVPGTYKVPVRYFDDLKQWVEVEFTVTVRSLEVVGEVTSTVKVGERYSFLPVVNHPDDVVSRVILTPPGQGSLSIDEKTGEVLYDATGAQVGVYTYEIIWTDDLGQSVTLIHNVRVWDEEFPPTPVPPTPTPPTPTPTPPTPTPPTPSPTPSPIVGTGGTVSGGVPGAGVAGLVLAGLAVVFAAALLVRRRDGDVGR